MTESSNYDGAPPVPPAYGIWQKVAENKFELHYEYFNSKPPAKFEDISRGAGWLPGGRGTIKEVVTISSDGKTFHSDIDFVLKDQYGKVIPGGGKAIGQGMRIGQ